MVNAIKRIFGRGEVDCEEVRHKSSDYLEDDLPVAKRSAIQTHIDNCGPCRAFVDTLASTIGLLSRLPKITAPSSFKQSVIDRTTRNKDGKTED